jgi:imidazole glycerol-phosphate synthase subunit HisH
MIVILDYGMGNVGSIQNMLGRLGIESRVTNDPAAVRSASKLILPGVGAFDTAMRRLNELGMVETLNQKVLEERTPLLGICLGMQLLTNGSEEGKLPGFGWVDAYAERFRMVEDAPLRVPHMGWREVTVRQPSAILQPEDTGSRFYFVHSYHVRCANESSVVATADYGAVFHAAVMRDNVVGTQFHPEKSHKFGLRLLERFARS